MSRTADPVMAINPYTGKLMNVEPLFDFWRNQADYAERMDDVIKTMLLNGVGSSEESDMVANSFHDFKTMFLYLYDIKEMFQRLNECEITIPKK